jgi:hypothetical protein
MREDSGFMSEVPCPMSKVPCFLPCLMSEVSCFLSEVPFL